MKTSQGLVIDGFMRGSAAGGNSLAKSPKIKGSANLLSSNSTGTKIRTAAQGVHQRAQRSQTLMRSAVRKPTQAVSAAATLPGRYIQPKARSANIDNSRVSRAQTIDQNAKIRHFGHVENRTPARQPAVNRQAAVVAHTKAPANSAAVAAPVPSMVTSASHHKLERMLDEALTRADAHKRPSYRQRSLMQKIKFAPRWVSVGLVLVAVFVLAGFVAMQKVPQVAMRVAASRAHVNAQVPAYVPSGFKFASPVKYGDGSVSVKYQANGNNSRGFTLTQKSSSMDSKSLADSVIPKNTQVQTSVVEGTTVYIYGNSNDAAWVSNGITYTIHDTANLNSDQLLKIAGGL